VDEDAPGRRDGRDEIPDLNVFMMCERLDTTALSTMPPGYVTRSMRPDELDVWKAFPFDTPAEVAEYGPFMDEFFASVYRGREEAFFAATRFVCDADDRPVATCAIWKAYGALTTVHWFKTLPALEGRGIGRALLSELMRALAPDDYPVYLHTQPGSFRAIKLYSDFGFRILVNERTGTRPNDHAAAMRYLEAAMPPDDFARLQTAVAPAHFEDVLSHETTVEF
jgi:ribosomal protein S18 acetylase RimI-like enzyme